MKALSTKLKVKKSEEYVIVPGIVRFFRGKKNTHNADELVNYHKANKIEVKEPKQRTHYVEKNF